MQAAGGNGSSRKGRFVRSSGGQSQDFDLNLAPIIDCLTVLITFILVSASYLSVGILESSVASASASPQTEEKQVDEMLSIEIKGDHTILVNLSGKFNHSHLITSDKGDWNYNGLVDQLALVKGESPELQTAVLTADNDVDYRQVVKSMEIAKKAVPSVMLGGF